MVKTALNDTYLGGTTPTELKNDVSKCQKMHNYRETQVMINQSVNEFYICLIFRIDALPQGVLLPLDIAEKFLKT